jgi:hypothetical protein
MPSVALLYAFSWFINAVMAEKDIEAGLDAAMATGYDPCTMTLPNSPVPRQLRCSSALLLGSGLANMSGTSARGLAARVSDLS